MIPKADLKKSLMLTWNWFRKSGVMLPDDGSWGIAERVLLTNGNMLAEKTINDFAPCTPHADHYVIEQRRADCCMESAFLFLQLHKLFGTQFPFRETAENILEFLYFRSGLLNRSGDTLAGSWDWSHVRRVHMVYFDDDSWMITLALKIAKEYPSLDRKYSMKKYALKLADHLADAAPLYFADEKTQGKEFTWLGNIRLPHWGSLACMALAEAYRYEKKEKYFAFIRQYEDFLVAQKDSFTVSEFGYSLLGSTCTYYATGKESSLQCAKVFADKIVSVINPENGSMPSEHYEAPVGKDLADTIYTLNWASLSLQNMSTFAPEYHAACEKILQLLLKIQDRTRKKHLYGCWRGMYDIAAGEWGGGDCIEGGANSIYTGWTNAPIAWVCAFELLKTNLMKA